MPSTCVNAKNAWVFFLKNERGADFNDRVAEDCEVIGNIYEKPGSYRPS
jgi:hypothetical protein